MKDKKLCYAVAIIDIAGPDSDAVYFVKDVYATNFEGALRSFRCKHCINNRKGFLFNNFEKVTKVSFNTFEDVDYSAVKGCNFDFEIRPFIVEYFDVDSNPKEEFYRQMYLMLEEDLVKFAEQVGLDLFE